MALPARANVPGSPMLHSYFGCCSVQSMVSDPESRGLDMRGGATLEGKQLLLSRQVRWSPEERQQNGQAGGRGGLRPAGQVSQNPATLSVKPLPLPHCLATHSCHPYSACVHCLGWLGRFFTDLGDLVTPPLWVMGLPQKMGSQGKLSLLSWSQEEALLLDPSQLQPQALQLWEPGWATRREPFCPPSDQSFSNQSQGTSGTLLGNAQPHFIGQLLIPHQVSSEQK